MVIAGIVGINLYLKEIKVISDADWSAPYLCSNWRFSGLDSLIYSAKGSSRVLLKELTNDLYRHISFLAQGQQRPSDNSSLVTLDFGYLPDSDWYQSIPASLFLRAPIIVLVPFYGLSNLS